MSFSLRKTMALVAVFAAVLILLLTGCNRSQPQPPGPPPQLPPSEEPAVTAPQDSHLTSVFFKDERTGWVAGYTGGDGKQTGLLLSTTDAGKTWTALTPPEGLVLQLRFADAEHGWAVSEVNPASGGYQNVAIVATTDGGKTWAQQWQEPFPQNLSSLLATMRVRILLFGSQDGYVQVGGTLLQTANGGANWDPVAFPAAQGFTPVDISFVDKQTGWVAGQSGSGPNDPAARPIVLATRDGGLTWKEAFAADTSLVGDFGYWGNSAGVSFADQQNGWLFFKGGDLNGRLYRTTDGGRHWMQQQKDLVPGRTAAGAPVFVNATSGWLPVSAGAAPFPGGIFITRDGGEHWTDQGAGKNWSINALSVVSPSVAWAAGTQLDTWQDFLMVTTDGGTVWRPVLIPMQPTAGLSLLSDGEGFGIGLPAEPKALLHTTDGGRTWRQMLRLNRTPLAICFVDNQHGWVLVRDPAGGKLVLIQTQDGGRTWATAGDLGGKDGVPGPTQPYLKFFDPQHGLVQTQDFPRTVVLATTDGGRTWTQQLSLARQPGWMKLSFTSPTQGFSVEQSSDKAKQQQGATVLETRDGGQTWTTLSPIRFDYQVQAVAFITANEGWLLAKHNPFKNPSEVLMHSTDGGRTWQTRPLPEETSASLVDLPPDQMQMTFLDGSTGWILAQGRVFYTRDGGGTWSR